MNIAVIGDYDSPTKYKKLLDTVATLKNEDNIIDLSRHKSADWAKLKLKRFADINNSHMVVAGSDWLEHFESRNDVHYAQGIKKTVYVESNGSFVPLTDHTYSL